MGKTHTWLESSPRRLKATTATNEARQSEALSFPYAQCLCDLVDHSIPIWERVEGLYHETGETSGHLPDCPQLGALLNKANRKRKSPGRPTSYLVLEQEAEKSMAEVHKKTARRKRKEAKRIGDAKARTESMKAVKQALSPYAQCRCDFLSDSGEEAVRGEARTMRHAHTDGSITFHLPNCLTGRFDYTTPRKSHTSLPKSTPYIDLEAEEETMEIRKRSKHRRRQPPKSAAYVDLETEEEEEGEYGLASPPATRYDPRTIASDFLRVIGEHPDLPPLNARMDGFPTKKKGRASK